MNAAEVAAALDSMQVEQHTKYYMAECPKCRRANKVPVKQLRRNVPPDWKPTPIKEKPTPAAKQQAKDKSAAKAETTAQSKAKTTSTTKSKSKTASKKKTSK